MFSDQVAEISLNGPSKCLDAMHADRITSRFVATTSNDNRLHVLRFHSEMNEFGVDGTLEMEPVDHLVAAPHDASLILTSSYTSDTVKMWRIPRQIVTCEDDLEYKPNEEEEESSLSVNPRPSQEEESSSLEQVKSFPHENNEPVAHVVWRGQDEYDPGVVFTLTHNGTVSQWDLDHGGRPVRSELVYEKPTNTVTIPPPRLACDPHHAQSLCVTNKHDVKILDWRADTSLPTGTVSQIKNAHALGGVTDVDYNPNKPHILATGGQDGLIKFWDLRFSGKKPLLVGRGAHSHWVSCVKYNPFHDQLVVSAGTDANVNLWRMSSISSAPLLQLPTTTPPSDGKHMDVTNNVRVAKYEHTDSVYNAAWGAADAWIYVSVAYDGKVVLNHVPSDEKYKILL